MDALHSFVQLGKKACTTISGSPFAVGKVDDLNEMCNLHADHSWRKRETILLFPTLAPFITCPTQTQDVTGHTLKV